MLSRALLALLLASQLGGCLVYEFEHEMWLRVDGSGTLSVTGRPELWAAFKGVGDPARPDEVTPEALRALFEASGLEVSRVTLTHRGGRPYLFVSADFDDVNRLGGSAAFEDLQIGLRHEGERLVFEGRWQRHGKGGTPTPVPGELVAFRVHVPARVYFHKNAADGVERGNILSWREEVGDALDGRPLDFGAEMGDSSILRGMLELFGGAIAGAAVLVAFAVWLLWRRGRRALREGAP